MSVLENFESWKDFLSNKIESAESQGMSQETISTMAYEIGDYLSKSVEAKNKEEAVLRELWNAASKQEQESIANAMVKLVQSEGQ